MAEKRKKETKEEKAERERKKAERFRGGSQCPGASGSSNGRYEV